MCMCVCAVRGSATATVCFGLQEATELGATELCDVDAAVVFLPEIEVFFFFAPN